MNECGWCFEAADQGDHAECLDALYALAEKLRDRSANLLRTAGDLVLIQGGKRADVA